MKREFRKVWIFPVLLILLLTMILSAGAEKTELKAATGDQLVFQQGAISGPESSPFGVALFSSDEEVQLYDLVYQGVLAKNTDPIGSDLSMQIGDAQTVCARVFNDHPELFYASYACYYYPDTGEFAYVILSFDAGLASEEVISAFDRKVESIIAETIRPEMTDLDRALALHDYLTVNCAYNWVVATNQKDTLPYEQYIYSAYGPLMEGDAVCQGYALAYKLLLNKAGISCGMVSGDITANEWMNHIWNWVYIDGECYQVDVTWDDGTPNIWGRSDYEYFLLSDEGMSADGKHVWLEGAPECTSDTYESGWIFNGNRFYLHYREAGYYYVEGGALYLSGLDGKNAVQVAELGSNVWSGVWMENQFYYNRLIHAGYADELKTESIFNHQIYCCQLSTGEIVALGAQVPWEKEPSPDGKYPADYDHQGLRISGDGTKLELMSATRRQVLYEVALLNHPVSWEKARLEAGETARLLGFYQRDTELTVGLLQDPSVVASQILWVAFYLDGQMVDIRQMNVVQSGDVLQVIPVDMEGVPEWDSAQVMLTSGWLPVCPSVDYEIPAA